MAISATINKVSLNIADMDQHYYQTHEITAAQHPSEADFRLMMRIIAFAFNASENLSFTKGLSSEDEPEIWQKSLTDEIELWIDFGQLDDKRIRKACGRADQVIIYTYNEGKANVWWEQVKTKLDRYRNLNIFHIVAEDDVETLVNRNMQLQCNIQDGEMYLGDDEQSFTVLLEKRK